MDRLKHEQGKAERAWLCLLLLLYAQAHISPSIYLFCREAAARNSDAAYLIEAVGGILLLALCHSVFKLANSWPIDDSGGKGGLHVARIVIGRWSQ